MTKVFKKRASELVQDDQVDLASCPYLHEHSSAEFQFATVSHVQRETIQTVVVTYEGIDDVGYPVDTVLTVNPAPIYLFPHELTVCETMDEDVTIGFNDEATGVTITDPTNSSCGRFLVEPSTYGLTDQDVQALKDLNAELDEAADDAINAFCLRIQGHLRVSDGTLAGMYFSDQKVRAQVKRTALDYAIAEINAGKQQLAETEVAGGAK